MAIRCSDTLTMPAGERRADDLIGFGPVWQRIFGRAGCMVGRGNLDLGPGPGPARLGERGRGHWLLARRSISDPEGVDSLRAPPVRHRGPGREPRAAGGISR